MDDIQVVGNDFVQGSFLLLPCSGERARASLFFARQLDRAARDRNEEHARWYFRASLSEFKSTFDVLHSDLRDRCLVNKWKESRFKLEVESHPLVKVLRKARDLAVHSMLVRGYGADFRVVVLSTSGESEEAIPSLFIDPIDLAIQRRGTGHISSDDVSWFNRQSACWPAHLLIQEAIYQASVSIRNFLVTADGVISEV
jgi:hypothetical protein